MIKLYLITRRDLEPGAQAAQLIHAMTEFCLHHPEITRTWYDISNTVVVLSVANEQELWKLQNKAHKLDIICSSFKEPDLDNQLTAMVLEPTENSKMLCKNLPLALTNIR